MYFITYLFYNIRRKTKEISPSSSMREMPVVPCTYDSYTRVVLKTHATLCQMK